MPTGTQAQQHAPGLLQIGRPKPGPVTTARLARRSPIAEDAVPSPVAPPSGQSPPASGPPYPQAIQGSAPLAPPRSSHRPAVPAHDCATQPPPRPGSNASGKVISRGKTSSPQTATVQPRACGKGSSQPANKVRSVIGGQQRPAQIVDHLPPINRRYAAQGGALADNPRQKLPIPPAPSAACGAHPHPVGPETPRPPRHPTQGPPARRFPQTDHGSASCCPAPAPPSPP